MCVLKTFSFIN